MAFVHSRAASSAGPPNRRQPQLGMGLLLIAKDTASSFTRHGFKAAQLQQTRDELVASLDIFQLSLGVSCSIDQEKHFITISEGTQDTTYFSGVRQKISTSGVFQKLETQKESKGYEQLCFPEKRLKAAEANQSRDSLIKYTENVNVFHAKGFILLHELVY